METLAYRGWRIAVDQAATRRATGRGADAAQACGCTPCRNYLAAGPELPPELAALVERLGASVERPGDVCRLGRAAPDRHRYRVGYPFVGRLLAGPEADPAEPEGLAEVAPGVRAGFTSQPALLPHAFRAGPAAQLELELDLPWALDAPPPL